MTEETSFPVASLTLPNGNTWYGPLNPNGLPHGEGIVKYPDGTLCYKGHMKDGRYQGYGVRIDLEGTKYEGTFENGVAHGRGTLITQKGETYEGEFQHDKEHGSGTYTFPDGRKSKGHFSKGKRHGRVTTTRPDGKKYEGHYAKGRRHGRGTMTWPNGSKFEGQYADGRRHGRGTMTWPNGRKFKGSWSRGLKHGWGAERDAHGKLVHEGDWENDELTLTDIIDVSLADGCCICHGEYSPGDVISVTGCRAKQGHVFHKNCLEEWLGRNHGTCPLCRKGGLTLRATATDESAANESATGASEQRHISSPSG